MKTFLLTGCTAGLGLALVKKLVFDYPTGHFIVVCRNEQKGHHVLEEQAKILKKNDGNLTGKFCCDLQGRLFIAGTPSRSYLYFAIFMP